MQPGTYSYQFLVDGSWMTSPEAPVAPDEDGHLCNRVSSTAVHLKGGGCPTLAQAHMELLRADHGGRSARLLYLLRHRLGEGRPARPGAEGQRRPDEPGNKHMSHVTPPNTCTCLLERKHCSPLHCLKPSNCYCLGGSCTSPASAHLVQWRDLPMSRSPSRARPQGGAWFMAVVPATFLGRPDSVERLEFCVLNGQNKVPDMHSC